MMKKTAIVLISIVLILTFAACNKIGERDKTSEAVQSEELEQGQKAAQENAEVLKEYEPEAENIQVPAVSVNEVENFAKDSGATSVTVKKDGTVDVEMSEAEFDVMMEKISRTILDKLEELRQSEDMIESVQTGLNFDKYYIFVDKEAYEAAPDAVDISNCVESAEIYHMLNGKKTKEIKLTLYIMNKDDDIELARKIYTIG